MIDKQKNLKNQFDMFIGLNDYNKLIIKCPPEYRDEENQWSNLAWKLFYNGINTVNWKWKSNDTNTREEQESSLYNVLIESDNNLSHKNKLAIAGWMLSEILSEVPVYIRPEK